MEKIINRLINHATVNVDRYVNNGSTWLIFTDTKQWVIELTESKTLWYNYNFFKDLFVYLDFDVAENQHYITKWVEETIINGVKETLNTEYMPQEMVEETIENGVKEIIDLEMDDDEVVEYIIQVGVKETHRFGFGNEKEIEDTIQNGVKETLHYDHHCLREVVNTIKNGVKETELHKGVRPSAVEDTIQHGVKETSRLDSRPISSVTNTIQNGIKHTMQNNLGRYSKVIDIIQNGVKETKLGAPDNRDYFINEAIQNGIKEVQPLPAQDGNRDWGLYYRRQGHPTKPHTEYVKEVIKNGEKF